MNHGGHREGAGRPQGSTNRATKEQGARLSELARLYRGMELIKYQQIENCTNPKSGEENEEH